MRNVKTGCHLLAPLLLALGTLVTGCSNPAKPESPNDAAAKTAAAQPSPAQAAAARELRCLALSMYWEAKAEGREGMLAVGHVVMNRVAHDRFPDTPCQVVFDGGEKPPCQFSWYCDGKSDRPTEVANWAHAQRLARELLDAAPRDRSKADRTRGGLFFHSTGMKSPWRIPRTRTVTIGGHVFYKL